ncbi:ferredoxin [Caldicellulosiruptor hydrothermalis 108]|uniref:Ferredoxin n=1 Tax=Caldicellulosiruptor hydrothermalis (strain DSM 18901 / VKM B-2411 / 108) TaxID=632292 RepID=E4Q895_CALH1|nr:ASKHA domain-containing protein [Caldicellulosiruptor hydrothermalis]ADQ07942.1 ferredoxin [Caldicellulosiruptor hydrothermalis 108]
MPVVKVYAKNEAVAEIEVEKNSNLLDILQRNSFDIEASCGGKGVCGKCKVRVKKGQKPYLENLTPEEKRHLREDEISRGVRLACKVEVCEDLDVFLEKSSERANILSHFAVNDFEYEENIIVEKVVLQKPSLDDQKSFELRLKEIIGDCNLKVLPRTLQKLARLKDQEFYAVVYSDEVVDVKNCSLAFGLAVDIGTTTVVCYLVDLAEGKVVDFYSFVNPQKKFGADVISRIDFAREKEEGVFILQNEIIKELNTAIQILADKNSISKDDIYRMVFVGNPTMLHLLLGVDPQTIAVSPFVPVFTESICAKPNDLGLEINPAGTIEILNSISAYVGADIVAGILSTQMHKSSKVSLLLDLGTNGEMVLGNSNFMLACSTAAGPAFEGVNISCGMGAVEGAIDSVKIENGKVHFTTIGAKQPVGICGSGVVDAIAYMLKEGIIDETGRFCDKNDAYKSYMKEVNGQQAFFITDSVYITQKDIREIQLAKAAISAGIKTMIEHAKITEDDIENIYLAGGFGNYINPWSAIEIGIIPKKLQNKIIPVGNSAGAGAVLVLLNRKIALEAQEIGRKVKYIELSNSQDFNQFFVESMMFENDSQEGEER